MNEQFNISLVHALYYDRHTCKTLHLIVARLQQLIHVGRLSVTCRGGLRAPVLGKIQKER